VIAWSKVHYLSELKAKKEEKGKERPQRKEYKKRKGKKNNLWGVRKLDDPHGNMTGMTISGI